MKRYTITLNGTPKITVKTKDELDAATRSLNRQDGRNELDHGDHYQATCHDTKTGETKVVWSLTATNAQAKAEYAIAFIHRDCLRKEADYETALHQFVDRATKTGATEAISYRGDDVVNREAECAIARHVSAHIGGVISNYADPVDATVDAAAALPIIRAALVALKDHYQNRILDSVNCYGSSCGYKNAIDQTRVKSTIWAVRHALSAYIAAVDVVLDPK